MMELGAKAADMVATAAEAAGMVARVAAAREMAASATVAERVAAAAAATKAAELSWNGAIRGRAGQRAWAIISGARLFESKSFTCSARAQHFLEGLASLETVASEQVVEEASVVEEAAVAVDAMAAAGTMAGAQPGSAVAAEDTATLHTVVVGVEMVALEETGRG